MSADAQAILVEFLALAAELPAEPPTDSDLQSFRDDVIPAWPAIELQARRDVDRLHGRLPAGSRTGLRALEAAPDLMGPLRLQRDEVRYVRGLAWLLGQPDPTGLACLASFLALVGEVSVYPWRVSTEVFLGDNGRVDLVLERQDRCVFVEAKIDALPRPRQLTEYAEALARRGVSSPLPVLLSLNPPGWEILGAFPWIAWEQVFAVFLPHARSDTSTGQWLASWLCSVGHHLLGLTRPGPIGTWPVGSQLRLLHLLHREGPDA